MAAIYRRFGFRAKHGDRPLAIGGRTPGGTVPTDTSRWLINYDWGDNGLRAPFPDHAAVAS
jgi:hypothetical protein